MESGPRGNRGRQALTRQVASRLLVSLLPVLLLSGWFNYQYAQSRLDGQVRLDITDRTRDVAHRLSTVLVHELERIDRLGSLGDLAAATPPTAADLSRAVRQGQYEQAAPTAPTRMAYVESTIGQRLKGFREEYPYRAVVLLADPSGALLGSSTPAWPYWDLTHQTWWPDLSIYPREDAGYITRPQTVIGLGTLLFVARPITGTGQQVQAVVVVGIRVTDLFQQIALPLEQADSAVMLTTADGTMLYTMPEMPAGTAWQPVLQAVGSGVQPVERYLVGFATLQIPVENGLDKADYVHTLNDLNWKVLWFVPRATAFAPLQGQLAWLALGMILTMIAGVGIALVTVSNLVTRPLRRLEEVIRDVRRYGLDPAVTLRAHLHLPQGGNEIGRLASTFDGMLQELTQLTHERTQNEARLALQYATARHLMEPGTLDALLPRVLRTVGEELGWEIAGFWQPDAAGQRLDYRAGWHRATLPAAVVVAWCRDWPQVPAGSLFAGVLERGEPDTDHGSSAYLGAETHTLTANWDVVAVPVLQGGRVQGIILGGAPQLPPLDTALARTLMTVGVQIGQTIDRSNAEEALTHRAHYDTLTGLPNRLLLYRQIEDSLTAEGTPDLALLLIDLDRFKEVNDTFGHDRGDILLVQVARRLRQALPPQAMVARLGGDEFAVLLPHTSEAEAVAIGRTLLGVMDEPFIVEGTLLQVGGSIGLALAPQHGHDAQTLLQRSDVAMYVAKRNHQGYTIYSAEQDEYRADRLALIAELRRGLDRHELLLHYQPQLDLRTGHVPSVEALMRWKHPQLGMLPPDRFIPLAEHSGLIIPMTRWALEAAIHQAQQWAIAGLRMRVAVNLSMWSLHDPELPAVVAGLLKEYNVPPAALCLELTESTVMTDANDTHSILTRLSRLGVAISIDDFGTGYSSLAYLKRLPVDELKIDKSFIADIATDPTAEAIVGATIRLGHSLGLTVVTEGVEDAATQDRLRGLGCDVIQGYHVSRPLPADALGAWLAARAAGPQGSLGRVMIETTGAE